MMLKKKMRSVFAVACLLASAGTAACGGNYSNEDLEFQTSIPDKTDLAPNIAAQLIAGSAESYKLTHGTVQGYRRLLGFVASLLDHVRRHPATTRTTDGRVWGPFADDKQPGYVLRVSMSRLALTAESKSFKFSYSLDFATKAAKAFVPVIYGTFDSKGGLGEGNGKVSFDVDRLRSIQYPVGPDIVEVRKIDITHSRNDGFRSLLVHQDNTATAAAPTADLTYSESPDGSATTRFVLTLAANLWTSEIDVVSAWRGDGAGRGEIKVTRGLATGLLGIDCWGATTVPTYVSRDWDKAANQGDMGTCVLPPLR